MQQRAWRIGRVGQKENSFAGNAHRRLTLKAFKQPFQLNAVTAKFLGQRFAAAHPCQHDGDHRYADDNRHIAAAYDLVSVGREETQFDGQYKSEYETDKQGGPAQRGAEKDDRQEGIDDHRRVHCDAVGGGQGR